MVAAPMLLPAPNLAPPAEIPVPNAPCAHEARRFLGDDHTAQFYRCEGCRAVLVAQRDRLWILRTTNGL